ncbi:uncharacterized protein J3D65DRAFT_278666 [Phyllosticta citribraziliensis]|uniref:U6 small nuclear RNA (adenine-(43)-N(6))-methyltransferase n=1 Tax=Phyllosticta citribraziliensis TaxID=989973 RepID=A0ABR1LW19_9PEZI
MKSILKKDFNIQLVMPEDRLSPTPSRALYVRWIKSLLDDTNPLWYEDFDPEFAAREGGCREQIAGLDIGTGASAIYPLLALRLYPKWFMYGTEIDTTSLEYAQKNLAANNLDGRCKLLQRNPTQTLIPAKQELERTDLDFVMTNPPFFSSVSEWQDSLSGKGKEKPPDSVCTGAEAEMVYEGEDGGGDYEFALRLYRESTQTSTVRAQWYSVMFGKKQSAHRFVTFLQSEKGTNFATFLLGATSRTRRWVVAWSWLDFRPQSHIARTEGVPPSLNPWPTDYSIPKQSQQSTQHIQEKVKSVLRDLSEPFEYKWNESLGSGVCRTREIVWNRSFRRRAKLIAEGKVPPPSQQQLTDAGEKPVGLGMLVSVEEEQVLVRWTQGVQRVWFESFCGFLHEQLRPLLTSRNPEHDKQTRRETFDHAGPTAYGEHGTARGQNASGAERHHTESVGVASRHDPSSKSADTSVDKKSFDQTDTSTRKRRKLA